MAVVGCSTDSEFSHWAWINTPRSQGGIQGVTYPIVSDINKTISADYGVLAGDEEIDEDGNVEVNGELIAYRGLFLIDKDGIVRHQLINDFPLGRSIDEAIRVVDALQHFELYGEVCPLGWHKGDAAMTPSHDNCGRRGWSHGREWRDSRLPGRTRSRPCPHAPPPHGNGKTHYRTPGNGTALFRGIRQLL